MSRTVPVCPLIQSWSYRFSSGFVLKSKRLSPERMNQAALEALRKHGVIYVTGEMFAQERTDRLFCFEHNTGIGKTLWVTEAFMPYLRARGQTVAFINVETSFPITKVIRGQCCPREIETYFGQLLKAMVSAENNSDCLVLDECDLLFPSGERLAANNAKETFSFPPAYLPYQMRAWKIISGLLSKGKKVILISWLHPQDASLSASYLGDKGFLRVFDAPVVEIKSLPPNEQFMYL